MGLFDWFPGMPSFGAPQINPTGGISSPMAAPTGVDFSKFTPGGMPLGPPPGVTGTATPDLGNGGGGSGSNAAVGEGDALSFADYLHSIGLAPGSFSGASMPGVPDLSGAVAGQYSPILSYLHKSIGKTKKEGKKAGKNLEGIYSDMALGNEMTSRRIERKGDRSTARLEKLYGNVGAERDRSIEKEAGAVAKRAKELGIRASVPASTEKLTKESAQQHRLFARQESRAVGASQQTTDNWSDFAKAGAQGARMEGAQAQAQLSQNVADLVFQLRGQIAQTQADKAAAVTSAMAQEYGMQMDAANAQNSLMMQKAGLGQDYQSMLMQLAQQQQGAGTTSTADLQGNDLIAALLSNEASQEKGVNQKDASAALESMGSILPQIQGSQQTDALGQSTGYADPTQSQFYQQLPQLAEQAGVSPELIRALLSRQVYDQYYGGG